MKRSIADRLLDSDSGNEEGPTPAAPEEPAPTPSQAVVVIDDSSEDEPIATVPSRFTCRSYQHPSTNQHSTSWLVLECWDEVRVGDDGGGGGSGATSSGGDLANASLSPLQFWIQRIGNRMVEADGVVQDSGNRIRWHLPPPDSDIAAWAVGHTRDLLSQGYVRAFYFGITQALSDRWYGTVRMRGHRQAGWHKMIILAASDSADAIGQAEVDAIAQFRRYDSRGILVSEDGHPLCRNRNPGREGAHAGTPPHLLYLCVSWDPRGR